MGLDTTHDCWHGSYTRFNCFRLSIAEAAGYKLIKKFGEIPYPDIPYNSYSEDNFLGIWEKPVNDPLLFFIAHSDCDGEIKVEQAKLLIPRLKEIYPKVTDEMHQQSLERFIKGLELAVSLNESVEFH